MAGLIDYAGLFPPAGLEMSEAVRNYAAYRRGEHAWALGRFIVPQARWSEFQRAAAEFADAGDWKVSVLAGGPEIPAGVDAVEFKVERAEEVRRLMHALPPGMPAYFEIPLGREELIAALAGSGGRAKVRTGGVTEHSFPNPPELARFLHRAARAMVPFKATAGLHHPVRSVHRLTYDPGSPSALMHGFVNLFLAAALVFTGGSEEEAVATLEEQSAEAFRFADAGVTWHGHRLGTGEIRAARERFAIGFGSCSFVEPLDDVRALGWR